MEMIKKSLITKFIAWFLTICLVITLIPDIGHAAETEPAAETNASEQAAGSEKTDAAESQQDDIVEKTETYTTYDLGDGKLETVFHGGQVRFENEDGELEDYDPSLEKLEKGEKSAQKHSLTGYSYSNRTGDKKHYLPENLSEDTPVRLEYQDYAIEFALTDQDLTQLEAAEETVHVEEEMVQTAYEDDAELPVNAVYGSEDARAQITYTSTNDGIKETLVLMEQPASNVFRYELKLTGMTARKNVTDGGITYYDAETEEITGYISAPWMNDASGDAYSEDIQYELEEVEGKDGQYILTMTIDEAYLSDESRQYPVTIDPTNTWKGSEEVLDVYVISGSTYANTNFYESGTKKMPAGKNSTGYHRTYIKFIDLKTVTGGYSVDSAQFTVYETGTGASKQEVGIYRITESWTTSKLTWNNKPTASTCYDTITTKKTENTAHTFDVTTFGRNVANGTITNYGLMLKNKTDDPSYACFYGSRNSSYKPKLVVKYYDKPTKATSVTIRKKTSTGTVSATYFREDASKAEGSGEYVYLNWAGITAYDLSAVQYRIIAADDTTTEPTAVGSTAVDLTTYRSIGLAASSATDKHVPYSDRLPEGLYRIYIRGKDAAGSVGTGSYRTFRVDGTVPKIDTLKTTPDASTSWTSNAKPTISWSVTEAYFDHVEVYADSTKIATSTSKTGSVTVTGSQLASTKAHTIKVIAYDKAGNTATASKYYKVDVTSPRIKSLSTSPATLTTEPSSDRRPTISWEAVDGNLSDIQLYVNGEQVGKTVITSTSTGFTLTEDLEAGETGYEIVLKAIDSCGNAVEKKMIYYLDTLSPVLSTLTITPDTSLLSPSANRSPRISWNISDGNPASVSYSMDGQSYTVLGSGASGSATLPSSVWTEGAGNYTIYVKAIDKAGNESVVRQLTYRLAESGTIQPQGLEVAENYGKRILTWQLDAYDETQVAYDVHRSTSADFSPSQDTLLGSDIYAADCIYIDKEILPAGTYYYKLVARDVSGAEGAEDYISNEASITNQVTVSEFSNRQGFKDYLSYLEVGLPNGDLSVEESSGNLLYSQTDLELAGPQLDYSLSRVYSSSLSRSSMLGRGWLDSWHRELYQTGEDLYFADSDGSCYLFEKAEDGTYSCAETKDYDLTETDTGYTITTKDQVVYTFNSFGQLISTEEKNGCSITNTYDELGRLSSVTSFAKAAGTKRLDMGYEGDSMLLSSVTDPMGTSYTYAYEDGDLTQVKIKNGSDSVSYTYGYGTSGKLEEICDAEGNGYTAVYTDGKATQVVYPDGERYSLSYSTDCIDITKKTPEGAAVYTESGSFDAETGKVLSHTDPAGIETSYSYCEDQPYLVEKESRVREYQSISEDGTIQIHNTAEEKDETVYGYDEEEYLISETCSDGTVTTYDYNDDHDIFYEKTVKDGETIQYETYDYYTGDEVTEETPEGSLQSVTDEVTGKIETYEAYNADGVETVTTEKEEDATVSSTIAEYADGNIVGTATDYGSEVSPSVKESDPQTSLYRYDAMGRVIWARENNIVTETTYDFLGRVTQTKTYATDEDVIVKTNTYDDNGSLILESETGKTSSSYTYDLRNRVIKEVTSGSDIQSRIKTTSYGYESAVSIHEGTGTRSEAMTYTETVTESGITTTTYTDVSGNVVREMVAGGTFTDYTYDKSGNTVVTYVGNTNDSSCQISMELHDADGNVFAEVSQPDVTGGSYRTGTDTIITYSEYDADGNLILATDGEGIRTKYVYDEEGRITQCYVGYADEESQPDIQVSYAVSETSGGTTTIVTDANGNTKTETTNGAGEITMVEDSGGDLSITTVYEYDDLHRKICERYADGSYIQYTYQGDSARLLSQISYTAAGTIEQTVSYTYDTAGRILTAVCTGSTGDETCKTSYSYDAEGKIREQAVTYAGASKQTTVYGYDSYGRLSTKTYPSDSSLGTITYTYDSLGRMATVSGGEGLIREYAYDGLGRICSITDHDGPGSKTYLYKTYLYDKQGRVKYMTCEDGEAVAETFDYLYDKDDQILRIIRTDQLLGGEQSIDEERQYDYDDHGNLISSTRMDNAAGTTSETTYGYDAVGNRISMTQDGVLTEYSYNGLDQLTGYITAAGQEIRYTYDQRGNQILEETLVSGEDEESEQTVSASVEMAYAVTGEMTDLVKTESGTTTLTQSNVYDQNGIRISRTENDTTRYYYYDSGSVAFTMDGSSLSSANVLSCEGTVIGTYRDDDYFTYLRDVQGSTTNIVQEDGTLAAAYEYSDFGETTELTGSSFDNQVCYTGAIYDESTELYYLNARYYDPATGRFISQDTYRGELDEPGQWHLYAYCANNPINYVDPTGHAFWGFWSEKQHYFAYNQNAIQKYLGYYDVYDYAVNYFGMEIGYFKRETSKWKIEFWKGQYGEMHGYSASSGCEIGLYYKKGALWNCAYQKDRRLRMRMSLYKKGYTTKMFTRDSKTSTKQGKAWWLTAFQPFFYMPGKSSASAANLKMTGTIWFGSSNKYKKEMRDLSKAFGNDKSYTTDWGTFKVKKSSNWKKKKFVWSYK